VAFLLNLLSNLNFMIKHLQKISLLLLAGLWLGSGDDVLGQSFKEDFEYPKDTTLVRRGWAAHSGAGTNSIKTSATGLSYGTLSGSNVGNAATLTTSGEDVNKAIGTTYNSGTFYTSFLVNFSSVQSTGDYFFHLGPETIGSTYVSRIYAKSTAGGLLLGAGISGTPAYGTEVLELNKTHLVVIKYTFASNDIAEIFVNPVVGGTEPATKYITATTGTDPLNIGTVALRQGTASSAPALTIDAIKVGTTWASVTPETVVDATAPTLATSAPFNPADNATGIATDASLRVTFNEAVKLGTSGTFTLNNLTDVSSSALTPTVSGSSISFTSATALQPGKEYAIQISVGAVTDLAGNAFAGITDNTTWNFTTVAVATPVLTTTASRLTFPLTAINKVSVDQNYMLSGTDLVGDVTVSVTGPFQIAKGDGATAGTFGTTALTFTQAEVAAGAKVYARFVPTAITGNTGTITHSSTNAQNVTVALTGTAYNPYEQNFNDANYLTNSGWTQVSMAGDVNKWSHTTTGPNSAPGAAIMNGFSEAGASNDWLISPAMDLNTFSNFAVLSFFSREFFSGPDLKLYVSTTYNGSGTIDMSQWTEINGDFPTTTGAWKQSQGINLTSYKSANTYIAFVYQTTAGGSGNTSEWKIDDVKVENKTGSSVIPTTSFSFPETLANNTSASQSFAFNALGYGDIIVTAPTGFQVSADDVTFSSSIVVPAASAAEGTTVFVRFAPATKQIQFTGSLAFAGTTGDLSANGPRVNGSSYPKSETFDVATYNVEFFASDIKDGNTEFGPTDDAKQIENVTTVMKRINADIFGLQEVSEEAELDKVLAAMPGYAKNISQVYSYSIKPTTSTDPFPAQKVGFIYNTATTKLISTRVMFEDLYRQAVAKTTTAIDDDFWSSGRLPYMGIFDVTIDGKTQRVHVITIHAKSGSSASDYDRRIVDLNVLKDSLNTLYANANIILLGDYNDDVSKSTRGTSFPSTYQGFVGDEARYKALTYELSQAGDFSYPSSTGGSFLDHLIISNELVDEYIEGSTKVEDARDYISGYTSNTSDHLPVFSRFLLTTNSPLVTFASASQTKTEGETKATFTLNVAEAVTEEQTIKVKVTGTAEAADYTLAPAATDQVITITLPANATSVSFDVTVADDQAVEAEENLNFEIMEVGSLLLIGTQKTSSLTIVDNDKATVTFALASASKFERSGSQMVELTLDKPSALVQTVSVSVTNGAGVLYTTDYSTNPAVAADKIEVTVPAGQTTASFEIAIINDGIEEQNETIGFEIATVSEKLLIGTAKTFTMTIENDDTALGVGDALGNGFGVYPNPTVGKTTLQLPANVAKQSKLSLTLYTSNGQVVLRTIGTEQSLSQEVSRMLQKSAAGLYLIKIQAGNETYQARVIKN
jgi:exonuclease III